MIVMAEKRYEVLVEGPTGHRTVHRVRATSTALARAGVEATLAHGHRVIDADEAGRGVGSRDRDPQG